MKNEECLKSNSSSLLVASVMQMVILLCEKAPSTSDQGLLKFCHGRRQQPLRWDDAYKLAAVDHAKHTHQQ